MWEMVQENIGNVSARTAFAAMKQGDKAGKEVVDKYISYLKKASEGSSSRKSQCFVDRVCACTHVCVCVCVYCFRCEVCPRWGWAREQAIEVFQVLGF